MIRALGLAALLFSVPAFAQKVVVLELDGDPQGKLRAQIEQALKDAAVVELIPLKAYKDAAAKKKMKGAAAMTPVGVKRASRVIRLDAAVGGEVSGSSYKVLIYDRAGEQLWTKELAVKKGLLSDDFAVKLARAVAAAGAQGQARVTETPPDDGSGGGDDGTGNTGGGDEQPGLDLTGNSDGTGETGPKKDDKDRDTDLDDPNKKKISPALEVPMFSLTVQGATTWRSQCLRPGVTSCKEYDLAAVQPTGISIDFTASVPYLGLFLNLDIHPLAWLRPKNMSGPALAIIQGFGARVAFGYGQSQTRIVEESMQGQGTDKTVKSDDLQFSAEFLYRYHFRFGLGLDALSGKGNPPAGQPLGYLGIHLGFQTRSFLIDPTAGTSLPSSDRAGFLALGAEGALPIFPFLRFEAGVAFYVNPHTSAEQIVGYGNLNDPTGGATATGFGIDAGVTGRVWGPLGYSVKWRMMSFVDRYYGQGQKWTVCNEMQCGGVGEESFHSIVWGLTGQF
ncbi:MAG: hypothetical protein U0228_19020 [Myxococcaceae bacterium]